VIDEEPDVIEVIDEEPDVIEVIDEEPDVIEVIDEEPDVIEVIDEDDASNKIQICHIPPGNPDNRHTIEVSEAAWKEHEMHGDSIGECNLNIVEVKSSNSTSSDLTSILEVDSISTNNGDKKIKTQKEIDKELEKQLKKEILIKEQKHQREKSMKKSELASYRDEFYKIKNELKLFKENGENTEDLKSKLQSIISDFQKTINILKNDYEYDDEYKTVIKTELTEKIKEKNEKMTTTERNFYSKVSSKLSELSKSNEPTKTAKDLGLQYKNGKTTVTITLSSVNQKVIDNLESIGKVNGVSGKHIQLTIDLKKLKDIESVPGVELITPAFSAIPS
ncbi:MAG TPA: hypothetical protein VD731_06905, partial [Nitrosopumilaceae archaeon]|nr:hypothetical protein [Nitrosopumilaceae archaeon]